MIISRIDTYTGSVLVAIGSPEAILGAEEDGQVPIQLLGGGTARLPRGEIRMTVLQRRAVASTTDLGA